MGAEINFIEECFDINPIKVEEFKDFYLEKVNYKAYQKKRER